MTEFYGAIADHYDEIFPPDPEALEFVRNRLPRACCGLEVLDVGCGTGGLALGLSVYGVRVTGVDLDPEMIRRASERAAGNRNLLFETLDMLRLSGRFRENTFHAVTCFGNTIAHLGGPGEIIDFFRQAAAVLMDGGAFLVQTLQYDAILAEKRTMLPTIENDRIRFERRYRIEDGSPHLLFQTDLTIKDAIRSTDDRTTEGRQTESRPTEDLDVVRPGTGNPRTDIRTIRHETRLYPVRRFELDDAFHAAGFESVQYFGDFREWPPGPDKLALVCAAVKPS
jgi:glycine/sarcosine N-methyltransferase